MRSLYEPYAFAVRNQISNFKLKVSNLPQTRLRAETVYFGGGTPSLLPLPLLAEILAACREAFDVPSDAEISLEANPGTVDAAYLEELRALGVDRLSLGVQSAHQSELDFFKRGHSFADAVEAVRLARAAGLHNLNVDLIYGIPHQTMAMWHETVEQTLELEPDHVSMYCLTVEERTTLALWVQRGKVPLPDDDLAADMVMWADERLAADGLARYEVSNWARSVPPSSPALLPHAEKGVDSLTSVGRGQGRGAVHDLRCRHNLIYWHNEPYLGFGAGAHSSLNGRRFWNVEHPREFVRRIEVGQDTVAGSEDIHRELEMGETMMLGLRLVEGVSFARFEGRFGVPMTQVYSEELRELGGKGLIEVDEVGVRLTQHGWLLGNRVFAAFLPTDR
jgi:oxygen-independent coproporphyrinogen-3 oxidase